MMDDEKMMDEPKETIENKQQQSGLKSAQIHILTYLLFLTSTS